MKLCTENNKILLAGHDNTFIIQINKKNVNDYINLARSYEAEFSSLTNKLPNELGIFEPDTLPIDPYSGYLLYQNNIPIGFCIVKISPEINDVAEFYITPSVRNKKLGYLLATAIFEMFPGYWQVRQISGADNAISFWRKVISKYTQNQYVESVINDSDWGIVTCQKFQSPHLRK